VKTQAPDYTFYANQLQEHGMSQGHRATAIVPPLRTGQAWVQQLSVYTVMDTAAMLKHYVKHDYGQSRPRPDGSLQSAALSAAT